MSTYEFFDRLPYQPDAFQVQAAEAVERGESVVVTAPTGAGKTLVAEAAVHLAVESGRRAMYTTPLKALSNQKYGDFVRVYGADRVGLLTGDNSVNGRAPVVVMTTEVLRNMIYANAEELDDVGVVVLDEVHYLQDRFRGAVWEEVIVHAPRHIQFVALSATVSNAGEFTDWVRERRGRTHLVIEDHRPVPLESLWAVKDLQRDDGQLTIEPLLTDRADRSVLNPAIERLLRRSKGRRRRFATPRRLEVLDELARTSMLPAIYFVFSRAGCEEAAGAVLNSGMRLTSDDERAEIREVADSRTAHLHPDDLSVLEFGRWRSQLEAGVAAHHAGMVPAFKEAVEALFARGLVKVVFATETLSLGINMPARTVVLDKITKFTGDGHDLLLPGEYTQLTGRAGRRGIDKRGYGVILYSPYIQAERVAEIAKAGSHALKSSFRPTYNMVANLVANYDQDRAEELLKASFGQFQRDRSLQRLDKAIARNERRLAAARADAECELGDVADLAASRQPSDRAAVARAAELLRVGDVIDIPDGRRAGRYLIVERRARNKGVSFAVVGVDGDRSRLRPRDATVGTEHAGRMTVPRPFPPVDPAAMEQLIQEVADLEGHPSLLGVDTVSDPGGAAACPDATLHLAALRKAKRLDRELARQRHQRDQQGEGLVGDLRRVLELLDSRGYTRGWALTDRGEVLRFIYNELDLLIAEALHQGLFDRLSPPELVAFVSAFVYEPRRGEVSPRWPTPALEEAWEGLLEVDAGLSTDERDRGLPETRPPESGFGALSYHWARGVELVDLLGDDEMAAGDFVRNARQVLDLLRQIRDAFPELKDVASESLELVDRGVVAAGGIG
jgi:ATP-dependent RNA helicase HelY